MLSLSAKLSENLRFLIFTAIAGVELIAGLIYLFMKPIDKLNFATGLLILDGGFGNHYDRALNDGRVVGFMIVQFGPLKTGIFNVVDVAIIAGLLGLLIFSSNWGGQDV